LLKKKGSTVLLASFLPSILNDFLISTKNSSLYKKTTRKKKKKKDLQIESPPIQDIGEMKLPTQKGLLPLLSWYKLLKPKKNLDNPPKNLFGKKKKKVYFP
jgi:hypothetical protein